MIDAIVVIGTGLIGTSVALAARADGVAVHLDDRDVAAARIAQALGAGRVGVPPHPVDLAVVAVPPAHVGAVLADAQRRGLARSYTDVASVKGEPERAVLRLAPEPSGYVGGHPMAGRERSGPLAARADLFRGRPWALTPSPVSDRLALERATELAVRCGGVPAVMSSAEHDEAVALISHVPHLVASLLAARLAAAPDPACRLAGQGLRDTTRIAAGDPALWTDIVRANAPAVASVLREVGADVSRLLSALSALPGDPAATGVVTELLQRGADGLSRIPRTAGAPDNRVRLRVELPAAGGELPLLLAALDAGRIGATDVEADGSVPDRVTVRFSIAARAQDEIRAELSANGWKADAEFTGTLH